jgi:hypothetical protein
MDSDPKGRTIVFPDTDAYRTLVVDLHMHSVFSDGHVWPRTRVEEALRDGLDAIAITEHLEWVPHLGDIVLDDRNRAFQIARDAAAQTDLMVISGSEITRNAPVGHINAIFIEDANALLFESEAAAATTDPRAYSRLTREPPPEEALQAAAAQEAFIFLNHPSSSSPRRDNVARLSDFHRTAIDQGLLHGIEVANWHNLSEEAFRLGLENDLTLLGVSDVHELIDWDYQPHAGGHRPVTLVLAADKTPDALREALFAGRTVVWFDNTLLGRAEHLEPLLDASVDVVSARYPRRSRLAKVQLVNRSDARLLLDNRSGYSLESNVNLVELPPHETVELGVRTVDRLPRVRLDFRVLNALTAPGEPAGLEFEFPVSIEDPEWPEGD